VDESGARDRTRASVQRLGQVVQFNLRTGNNAGGRVLDVHHNIRYALRAKFTVVLS